MNEAPYEVKYENGCSHFLMATSVEEALKIADESLRSCLPKNFNFDTLVKVVMVRNVDLCKSKNKEDSNFLKLVK